MPGLSRLTRVEQQKRTHARLLDAGRSVCLRRGFLAATVEEIAATAGYTRGAVYKHFGGKEGLWQAIVDARIESLLLGLRNALDQVTSRAELLAAFSPTDVVSAGNVSTDVVSAGDVSTDVVSAGDAARWTVVSAEFLAAIATHPTHAAALAASQRHLDEEVAGLLAPHCRRLGIQPAVPLPQLVVAWGAMGGGLALLNVVDPTTDVPAIAAGVLAVLLPPADESSSRD